MGDWMRKPITGNIEEVPGIGPATAKKLAASDEGITTTYQLLGKFMMLKGSDSDDAEVVDSASHMEFFWVWLADLGITSHRSAIVKAIAEKLNTMMPGIYDPDVYDDDEDEE